MDLWRYINICIIITIIFKSYLDVDVANQMVTQIVTHIHFFDLAILNSKNTVDHDKLTRIAVQNFAIKLAQNKFTQHFMTVDDFYARAI